MIISQCNKHGIIIIPKDYKFTCDSFYNNMKDIRIKRRSSNGNRRETIYNKCNGKCFYCGCNVKMKSFIIDHYIPLALGGTNKISNLVPSCQNCDNEKKNIHPDFVHKRKVHECQRY